SAKASREGTAPIVGDQGPLSSSRELPSAWLGANLRGPGFASSSLLRSTDVHYALRRSFRCADLARRCAGRARAHRALSRADAAAGVLAARRGRGRRDRALRQARESSADWIVQDSEWAFVHDVARRRGAPARSGRGVDRKSWA